MVEFSQAQRTIKVKIAYYGPAVGGKTTNIKILHERARRPRRGNLLSVNSHQDRTIIYDLLPLNPGGFRGFDLRLQLLAVPGQSIYSAPRRAVLKGCDGVVFVANSATDRWGDNIQSFQELTANLRALQLDPNTIPLVFQYNKRDLLDVMEMEALDRGLNGRGAPTFPAVARLGEGVRETFSAILTLTLENLSRRYRVIEMRPGQTVAAWTEQALSGLFGRDRLDEAPAEEAAPPSPAEVGSEGPSTSPSQHLKVQIAMPEETARPSGAEGKLRSAESLAQSYAEASAELGLVVSDLREEHERAHARLTEIQWALEIAEQGAGEVNLEERAARVLSVLMRAAKASNAALFLTATEAPQILVLPPLVADPLSRSRWGASRLEQLQNLRAPRLETAAESPELAQALSVGEPAFEALAIVPLRSAERPLGLALLYYWPHAPQPSSDTLTHLGFLARVLVGPLEATAARESAGGASRLRALSRASATAVASLVTRLPPSATRRGPVSLDDVLAPLRAPGVSITVAPDTRPIGGDPVLLRFALATLIHRCEAAALERGLTPVIEVRAAFENQVVRVQVTSGGGGAGPARASGSLGSDAEMSAVNAVVAMHEGFFLAPDDEGPDVQFTLQFNPL